MTLTILDNALRFSSIICPVRVTDNDKEPALPKLLAGQKGLTVHPIQLVPTNSTDPVSLHQLRKGILGSDWRTEEDTFCQKYFFINDGKNKDADNLTKLIPHRPRDENWTQFQLRKKEVVQAYLKTNGKRLEIQPYQTHPDRWLYYARQSVQIAMGRLGEICCKYLPK